jgi:signal transduction histidine kinase
MRWVEVFGFDDEALNRRYESRWLITSIPQLRIALLLAAVFSVGFLGLDSFYFDAETLVEIAAFRVGVMLPLCLACYAMTYLKQLQRWVFPACGGCIIVVMVYFCSLAVRLDDTFLSYLFPVIVQLALFLFVLLRIPFRISLVTGLICLAVCAFTFSQLEAAVYHRASIIAGTISIFAFLLFNLFQRDLKERSLFLNELLLAEAERVKASLQREREDWFRNFAGFLRHELNNQLVGMQGSLDLLARVPDRQEKYLTRANASLERMRAMVNEAADATSIDTALENGAAETCDLSLLVLECVASYEDAHPGQQFDVMVEPAIHLTCQPFRVVQMLDKLVHNALRHCTEGSEILVRLYRHGARICLEVENEGDALPENREKLFRLWFTGGSTRGAGGRQGLGLYVVSRIAAAHGATVEALDLPERQGALFRVVFAGPDAA